MQKLSIEECLQTGWELFKKRSWFFIGFTAFIFAVSFIVNTIDSNLSSSANSLLHLLNFILSTAFSIYISFGQTRFFLRAHDSIDQVRFSDFWSRTRLGLFAALYVVLTACLVIGLVLLIVPGILFALISMFAIYILIDSDHTMTPMEAFKESRRITKGHLWELFLFSLTLLAINILGAIALVVGLLVTIPVSLLASVHAYRSLERIATPTLAV